MRIKLITIGLAISTLTISPCKTFVKMDFSGYLNINNTCDYIDVKTIKSTLSINQEISTNGQYSDSLYKGFIGAECDLSWDDNNDESQTITFSLTQLKSQDVFPPKKLSEQQLLNKIAQADKSTEEYLSHMDSKTFEFMKKQNSDTIRAANNYQMISELGDAAYLIENTINNDDYLQEMAGDLVDKEGNVQIYILSIKSGQIILKIYLSSKNVVDNTKEKLINLSRNILS